MALGGAAVARGDDAATLRINPAGLARIPRMEIRAGLALTRHPPGPAPGIDVAVASGGRGEVAAAWPIPVLRGALVLAGGVFRAFDAPPDAGWSGPSPDDGAQTRVLVQRRGGGDATVVGAAVALARGVSVGASLDLLDGAVRTLVQQSRSLAGRRVDVTDDVTWEIDGLRARAGIIVEPRAGLRLGAVVTLPGYVNAAGEARVETVTSGSPGHDGIARAREHRNVDVILPARVALGAGFDVAGVGIELGMARADWSRTTLDRRRLITSSLEPVLGAQTTLRAALEWSVPGAPVRLRGALGRSTWPGRYERPDRLAEVLVPVEGTPVLRSVSLGVGVLIADRVVLDAGWSHEVGRVVAGPLARRHDADRLAVALAWRR